MLLGLKRQEEADELGCCSKHLMPALLYSGDSGNETGDAFEHLFEFRLMVLVGDGRDCGESWEE